MSKAMNGVPVVRAMSQSLCLVLLLLTCCARAAQNEEHRIRNIVLVHGAWAASLKERGTEITVKKTARRRIRM
jgi:hypothetical protein